MQGQKSGCKLPFQNFVQIEHIHYDLENHWIIDLDYIDYIQSRICPQPQQLRSRQLGGWTWEHRQKRIKISSNIWRVLAKPPQIYWSAAKNLTISVTMVLLSNTFVEVKWLNWTVFASRSSLRGICRCDQWWQEVSTRRSEVTHHPGPEQKLGQICSSLQNSTTISEVLRINFVHGWKSTCVRPATHFRKYEHRLVQCQWSTKRQNSWSKGESPNPLLHC